MMVDDIKTKMLKHKQMEEGLKASEERLKILYEYAPDAYYLNDLKGNFIDGNKAAERLIGYEREELIGKNILKIKLLFPGQIRKAADLLAKNVKRQATGPDEFILRRKDGSAVHVEIRTYPIEIKGECLVLGIARDITKRKEAERARLDAEKKYRDIFDNAIEGIFQTTQDGRFISVNSSMAQILGYKSPEELIGSRTDIMYQGYVNPKRRQEFMDQIEKYGKVQNFEYQAYRKDGKKVWLSENVRVVRNSDGKILYYEGTAEDITRQKLAEDKINEYSQSLEQKVAERTMDLDQALRDAEEARDKIDAILKSVADGIIVIDVHNNVVLMNSAAENLLRVPLREVINRPIDVAVQDKTLRDRIKAILPGRKIGDHFDFEVPGEDVTNPRVIRARTSAVIDKKDKIVGIVVTMNDVTYEREVDRMKTEFITSAAHELRTPITTIRGFSEILLSKGDVEEEDKEKFLTYINQQSVNMTEMINDLFLISRLESGKKIILNKTLLDISILIRDTTSKFKDRFPESKFRVTLPDKSIELMADEERLRKVLESILSNAVKFSSKGGLIKVGVELSDGNCLVSVEDKGIGMRPDQIERVFEKYYRADSTDTALGGAGLGMTIVRYIVEAHEGKVWVKSKLGKGTAVRFTIPLQNEINP